MNLGVNIDHVATLREARYKDRNFGEPDPVEAALACEKAGAQGITAHLREDRRHIQLRDVLGLRLSIGTRLNLEISNTAELIELAIHQIKPDIVCLVPERRQEITTEGGLDAAGQIPALRETCQRLNDQQIEVSLFLDPAPDQIAAAATIGCQFVELHTGSFAEQFYQDNQCHSELQRLQNGALQAHAAGLKVNAGHGLNRLNLPALMSVPHLIELNIGHSIISRALTVGLAKAVQEMLEIMKAYKG